MLKILWENFSLNSKWGINLEILWLYIIEWHSIWHVLITGVLIQTVRIWWYFGVLKITLFPHVLPCFWIWQYLEYIFIQLLAKEIQFPNDTIWFYLYLIHQNVLSSYLFGIHNGFLVSHGKFFLWMGTWHCAKNS